MEEEVWNSLYIDHALQHLISWHYHRLISSAGSEQVDRNPPQASSRPPPRPPYDSIPITEGQLATSIIAPVQTPGVPEEEPIGIIALNGNHMELMWVVVAVTLWGVAWW